MNRTINGYQRDLPHIQDIHESSPGHWEGRTITGDPFFILGGTRAKGGRHEWYTMCPNAFASPEPRPVRSLAEGLQTVEDAVKPKPEPEVTKSQGHSKSTPKSKAPAKRVPGTLKIKGEGRGKRATATA
jgi:hypothetical protein